MDQITAVYLTEDICRLFACSKNSIPSMVKAGIIPKPMGLQRRGSPRRWAKAVVDRKLGSL